MNPAIGIVRRVFPSYSNPTDPRNHGNRNHSQSNMPLPSSQRKSESLCDGSNQQMQRLRQTVFKLNMQIAACRGAKQRLEATVNHYENMQSYYLTELQVRKARADCLEAQLAMVLQEFPSHRPLKIPDKQDNCEGCEQSEKIITKLAHELNLKNKLLIRLDETYKQVVDRVATCLKEYKAKAKEKQALAPIIQAFISEDDENKQNAMSDKIAVETQTFQTNNSTALESLSGAVNRQPQKVFKKSKVILKRVMPQRSAEKQKVMNVESDKC